MAKELNIKERTLLFIKKHKKRTATQTLLAFITCIVLLAVLGVLDYENREKTGGIATLRDEKTKLVAVIVGDISFEGSLYKAIEKKNSDEMTYFVRDMFADADYVTGSMVGPSLDEKSVSGIDKKRIDTVMMESVQLLKKLNFSVAALIGDKQQIKDPERLNKKIKLLRTEGIDSVGAGINLDDAKRISYRVVNGVTVATLGFSKVALSDSRATEKSPGILFASPWIYVPLIKEAKENADLVIVHVNWGDKYSSHVTTDQRLLAKAVSNAGADIIIGHNSQVTQPIEIFNNTVILYNLGNVFSGEYSINKKSIFCKYVLNKDGSRRIEVVPISIINAQPRPATGMVGWVQERVLKHNFMQERGSGNDWTIEGNKLVLKIDAIRGK